MSEIISRSEQKRIFRQIEATAKELVELKDHDLKRLPCSQELKDELVLCRKTKAGARKRQIKYVAKLLNYEPFDEILLFLQKAKGSKLEENRNQHEAERLRDLIIDEALLAYSESRQFSKPWEMSWHSAAIEQVVTTLPGIDENELRQCAHRYVRGRNKTYYRELFRIVKAAADKKRLSDL